MIPRSRDPLTLAMEQLMQALAKANERAAGMATPAPAEPLSPADASLMEAVSKGDIAAIAATIAGGADANAGKGKPLQAAAARNDESAMKELVILGAEVSIAVASLQEMQEALNARKIPVQLRARDPEVRAALQTLMEAIAPQGGRYRISDKDILQLLTELDRQGGGVLSSPDESQGQRNQQMIHTLQAWEKKFIQSIAPVETLRMQRKIMDALAEMKQELTQKTLDKPKLAAPRKTEPPQPE